MKLTTKTILAGLTLCAGLTTNAAELASPSFDTYSYVFIGNSYPDAESINISQYYGPSSGPAASHFFFGLVQFDTGSLNTSGDKYLLMQAGGYTDGSMGAPVTSSGSYTVNVGIMPAAFSTYQAAGDHLDWFDTNILSQTPIGTLSFTNQGLAALDVTSTVNDWINGSDNFGFVLWSENAGSVEIFSSEGSGFGPQLNSNVPEPQTYAMIGGVLALGVAVIRRRKLFQK